MEGGKNEPDLLREGLTGHDLHDLSVMGHYVGNSHPPTMG